MKRVLLVLALCLGAATVSAAPSAQVLLDKGDYAGAAEVLRKAAAAGSAEAQLQLGIMADRGLGQPRDPVLAFRWYRAAAEQGLAEAQFNTGVMLDAGIGMDRDATQALVWYSRAALRGHARAQFNAALLMSSGEGAPANATLAAYWLQKAETLPAARAALAALPPQPLAFPQTPRLLFSQFSKGMAEVIWSSPPGAARYALEILALPADGEYTDPVALAITPGSAVQQVLSAPPEGLRWRVVALAADHAAYATTPWQGGAGPNARVQILSDSEDPRIAGFARRLADDLRNAGFWVRTGPAGVAPGTSVAYAWLQDRETAGRIATFLPSLSAEDTHQLPVGATLPGEIVVRLGGGGARVARTD